MKIEECSLSDYTLKKTPMNDDSVLESVVKERTAIEFRKEKVAERIDGWKEKPLHGQRHKWDYPVSCLKEKHVQALL